MRSGLFEVTREMIGMHVASRWPDVKPSFMDGTAEEPGRILFSLLPVDGSLPERVVYGQVMVGEVSGPGLAHALDMEISGLLDDMQPLYEEVFGCA